MTLSNKICRIIKKYKTTFGIVVKNLNSGEKFLYNPNEIFPAASIIKIPILIETLRQIEAEKLSLENKIHLKESDKVGGAGILKELHAGIEITILDLLNLMIVISDNTATNILIDLIGIESVNNFMRSIGLTKSILGRKLMINPKTLKYKNFVTPYEMSTLLEKLWQKRLLSSFLTKLALNILYRQQYNEKIPKYFPKAVKVAHKTGEISKINHDVGIVVLGKNPFILSLLTKEVEDIYKINEALALIAKEALNYFRG
ncbi:MAG: serine hydrolase [Armatimonadetes bacterium]|nr:serine hydrolase [Armatimonadota bacterium]